MKLLTPGHPVKGADPRAGVKLKCPHCEATAETERFEFADQLMTKQGERRGWILRCPSCDGPIWLSMREHQAALVTQIPLPIKAKPRLLKRPPARRMKRRA